MACQRNYLTVIMLQFDSCAGEVVGTNIRNGFVNMTIKFLHFVIAKCMQFRYCRVLYPARFTMSWLFWIVFSRSISSSSNAASLLAFIFGYCHCWIFHSSWQNESHLGYFLWWELKQILNLEKINYFILFLNKINYFFLLTFWYSVIILNFN